MYKIDANPTFKRDVKFLVPVDGGFEENSISVIYKALDVDEISKFDQTNLADQKKYLIAVISEVGDVCDMAGKPLPYNHALRDRLINLSLIHI